VRLGVLAGPWWSGNRLLNDGMAATLMTVLGVTCGWITGYGGGFQPRVRSTRLTGIAGAGPRAIFGLAAWGPLIFRAITYGSGRPYFPGTVRDADASG
jgi:hypothetical protein